MLRRYVEFIVKRPWTVIALVFLCTAFFAVHLWKLRLHLEPDAQIPPDHRLVQVGQELQKDFGGKYMALISISPKQGDIYNPRVLGKVKTITERALKLPGLRSPGVLSLLSNQVQDISVTNDEMVVKPFAAKVPTTTAELASLRKRVEENGTISGLLVNKNATAAVILVDFADFEAAGGAADCHQKLEAIVASERDPDTTVTVAGMPSLLYWYLIYTQRVILLFVLTVIMTAFIQYRTFRTFQGMIIPLLTALLGVVWAMGMMGFVGATLDPWNIMTPILVLAIAAGHSTQILKRYYEEFARLRASHKELSPGQCNREAVVAATTKVGGVMLAAGFIAFLSFGSLMTFTMPSMRGFGLATAFGILASLLMEMTLIPAVRSLLRPPTDSQSAREQSKAVFDPILAGLARMIRNGQERWILLIASFVLLICMVGAFRIDVNNSMDAQFFASSDIIHSFHEVSRNTAGPFVLQVLVDTKQPEGVKDPAVLERMNRLEEFVKNQPKAAAVGHIVSVVDFLKLMNRRMNGDTLEAEVLPDTKEKIGQYLMLYSFSGEKSDMDRFVDFNYQKASMMINMQTDDARIIGGFIERIRSESARLFAGTDTRVEVGGGVAYLIALNETIIKGKVVNLIQIAAIILIITSLLLRSFLGGLLVMIPLFCSVVINFGMMGWAGIWFSMGTAAISAMAAGIGADYAIYFIFRVREEARVSRDVRQAAAKTLTTSGKAIASVAVAIGTGYLCLSASGFELHFLCGVLVALMMISSCLGALALLPSLLVRILPRFLN